MNFTILTNTFKGIKHSLPLPQVNASGTADIQESEVESQEMKDMRILRLIVSQVKIQQATDTTAAKFIFNVGNLR